MRRCARLPVRGERPLERGRDLVGLALRDDERRRDAQDAIVRFLHEQALTQQRLRQPLAGAVEFDSDQQPAPTHLADARIGERAEARLQLLAANAGVLGEVFVTITRSAARATWQASGLPPNVLP